MYKFIVVNCYIFFCLFIIAYIIVSCAAFTCVHDEVTDAKVHSASIRSSKYQDIRADRARDTRFFEPLKILFYTDELDQSLSTNTMYNIDVALRKIRKYVSETFQVRKRKMPFTLDREGCTQTWQSGMNRGKCAHFKADLEMCRVKEIEYKIPNRYLDSLELYDFDNPVPKYSIQSGAGVLDSNFLIFITSYETNTCAESDILAYGTYCRLDRRTSEPLAGILNLCPSYFAHIIYPSQHYYNVLLHEVFHILGFSYNLFEKYLLCEKGIHCEKPKNIILEDEGNIPRLVFPFVVKNMRIHFGCADQTIDFGAPLSMESEQDNTTEKIYSSHWHPLLMYSSIMTSRFSEDDYVFVDNITLATFASTGWYRVNFSNAENFRFGRGQGCQFGLDNNCSGSIYLCDPSVNRTGCDLLHKSIGSCKHLVQSHPCGIYQPHSMESCDSTEGKQYELDFFSLNYKQKCFFVQESETVVEPFCLPVKCQSDDAYAISIENEWFLCHYDERIRVGDKALLCPPNINFCDGRCDPLVYSHCTEDDSFFISVRMSFDLPTFVDLSAMGNFKNFKVTTLRGIASKMDIPVNYIMNATLFVFKSMSMDFAVCPPATAHLNMMKKIMEGTQRFLDYGKFMHILKAPQDMLISSSDIRINPSDAVAFRDYEGFRTLLIFPFIIGVFLVATITASLVRLYFIKKNRPRRTTETDDTELSDVQIPS